MKCPQCFHGETKVLDSRLSHEGKSIRRRRCCIKCNYRFTTYEKEEEFVFQIQKRDGRPQPYQREKALQSIQVACQKRPVTIEDIETLLLRVERKIQEEGKRLVPSSRLGDLIIKLLYSLDKVAYIRFASVYKDFKDTDEFLTELNAIKKSTAEALSNKQG